MVTSLPVSRFCPTVKYIPWFPLLLEVKIVCDVNTETQYAKRANPLLSNADVCSYSNFEPILLLCDVVSTPDVT
jgi:hypothetical protein